MKEILSSPVVQRNAHRLGVLAAIAAFGQAAATPAIAATGRESTKSALVQHGPDGQPKDFNEFMATQAEGSSAPASDAATNGADAESGQANYNLTESKEVHHKKPKHEKPGSKNKKPDHEKSKPPEAKKPAPESKHKKKKPKHHVSKKPGEASKPKPIKPTSVTTTTQPGQAVGTPPPETTPTPPTNELQDLHPENLYGQLTPEIQELLNQNSAYIPALGCSAWILRDENGLPVGVIGAKHCGFLPADGNLSDTNGQLQFNFQEPLVVTTGSEAGDSNAASGDSTEVGVISYVYLDQTNTNDLFVGVLSGFNNEDVLSIAQNTLMPTTQSTDYAEGTAVFAQGKPIIQPNNTGPSEMQTFASSVLGYQTWAVTDAVTSTTSTTENIPVMVTAVVATPDGSECSPGSSGMGYVANNVSGQPQLVGIQSAYNDWGAVLTANNPTQAQANLNYFQSWSNATLGGYTGVCGASQSLPTAASGAEFIPVANTNNFDYEVANLEEQLKDNVQESPYQPEVINGLVYMKGMWWENPIVDYDSVTDTLILGACTTYSSGGPVNVADQFQPYVYENASQIIQDFQVYSVDNGTTPPAIITSPGNLVMNSTNTAFLDKNNLTIGLTNFPSDSPPLTTGDPLQINNGQIEVLSSPNGSDPVANPSPVNPGT